VVTTFGLSFWVFEDSDGVTSYSASYGSYQVVQTVIVASRSAVLIDLPVYLTRVVQVSRAIRLPITELAAESTVDSGPLIGAVAGGAVILALMIGASIFIVRLRKKANLNVEPPAAETDDTDGSQVVSLDDEMDEDVAQADPDIMESMRQYGGDDPVDDDVFDALAAATDSDSIFI
jgi:hypothetical protein